MQSHTLNRHIHISLYTESATNSKTRLGMAKVRVELESVWVGLEDDNSPFDSKVGI